MASFLIDDYAWPSEPGPFKRTNVLLHLLAGSLVLWLGLLIGRARGLGERTAAWGALLGAALWLLHPLWVSTTLYVVQRMAILSAILVLAGLTAYVSGRLKLARGHVRSGLTGMAAGVGLFTPLAFLAKENGALLPLLALVAEATVLRGLPVPQQAWTAFRWLRVALLGLPNLAIAAYFALTWDQVLAGYDRRAFSLGERLLTEPRALWSYVRELLLPRIQTGGLYHDDYPVSTGLLSPWTTLPALLGLLLALLAALRLRRARPLLSFAILFFLAGHALESTFISLELYFEHRNYLPATGLFLAAGLAVARAAEGAGVPARAARIGGVAAPALLAALTWLRADLWGDPATQALIWARMHPASLRAQQQAAIAWLVQGRSDKAEHHIRAALLHHPQNVALHLQLVSVLCSQRKPLSDALKATREIAARGAFQTDIFANLRRLLNQALRHDCKDLTIAEVDRLAETAIQNQSIAASRPTLQGLLYIRATAALTMGDFRSASQLMTQALQTFPTPDFTLHGAALLATYGQYDEALQLLDSYDELSRHGRETRVSVRDRIRWMLLRYNDKKRRLRRLIEQDRAQTLSERWNITP